MQCKQCKRESSINSACSGNSGNSVKSGATSFSFNSVGITYNKVKDDFHRGGYNVYLNECFRINKINFAVIYFKECQRHRGPEV